MSKTKSQNCLNCGHEVNDASYCAHCGQPNTHHRIPLKLLFKDFFGDYFTFDSKFFHSLFPLFFKPGHLTREYLSGRRVSYIFPLRLYVFTSFLFFFIIAINAKIDKNRTDKLTENEGIEIGSFKSDSLRSILSEYGVSITQAQKEQIISQIDSAYILKKRTANDSSNFKFTVAGEDVSEKESESFFIRKAKYISSQGKEGTRLFWKEVVNQIPKVLFLLLPLFALILKLLYIRQKLYFVEHLIFSLHFHTFLFMVLILTIFFPKWFLIIPVILIILIYLIVSMRNFYQQSWLKTILKYIILLNLYILLTIPAFILLVVLAVISA